jgi:hypothetical protein
MLCDLCTKVCQLIYGVDKSEPLRYESLEYVRRSAEGKCQVCYLLWSRVKALQGDLDFGLDQTALEPPPGTQNRGVRENSYISARLALCARSHITFVYGSKERRTALLELSQEYGRKAWNNPDRISTTTAYEKSLSMAKQWLEDCRANHPGCDQNDKGKVSLPTRLAQVSSQLRLVKGSGLPDQTQYIALSHCWGLKPIYTLRQSILHELLESIPMEKLPKGFQDAIEFTRALHVDYIWIDSFCIIQDSETDWLSESTRMKDVYSNWFVNLAITGFANGQDCMFSKRDASLLFEPIQKPGGEKDIFLIDATHLIKEVDTAPLNGRAWVLQERLLSPRTIHFGRVQIFWECREIRQSEALPDEIPIDLRLGGGLSVKSVKNAHLGSDDDMYYWFNIVKHYNELRLTNEEDRLGCHNISIPRNPSQEYFQLAIVHSQTTELALRMLYSLFKTVLIVFLLIGTLKAHDVRHFLHMEPNPENQETFDSLVKTGNIGDSSLFGVIALVNSSTNYTYEISNGEIQLHMQLQNETEAGFPLTVLLDIVYESEVNLTHQYAGSIS